MHSSEAVPVASPTSVPDADAPPIEENTTSAGNESLAEEATTAGNDTMAQNTTTDAVKEEAKPKKIYKKYDALKVHCV